MQVLVLRKGLCSILSEPEGIVAARGERVGSRRFSTKDMDLWKLVGLMNLWREL